MLLCSASMQQSNPHPTAPLQRYEDSAEAQSTGITHASTGWRLVLLALGTQLARIVSTPLKCERKTHEHPSSYQAHSHFDYGK